MECCVPYEIVLFLGNINFSFSFFGDCGMVSSPKMGKSDTCVIDLFLSFCWIDMVLLCYICFFLFLLLFFSFVVSPAKEKIY